MRFGQNVLRMAWKARFVQFSYKAYCFHVLAWISVPQSDFWLWNVEKCDLVKTSSAWPEKHVLYNFHRKPTCFHVLALISVPWAIFGSGNVEKCDLAKTSSAWPEKHVLYNFHTKPTVFTYWREFQSGRASFGSAIEKFWSKRPRYLKRKPKLLKSPVRFGFGQNVLRMAWKARFVQFSYKTYCFHLLA